MNEYNICTNYTEIVAGTNNHLAPVYIEAAKSIDENGIKGLSYLKNFITSIENIAGKENVKDERITKSKGNIKNFQGYNNIKTAIEFLNKTLKGLTIINDLIIIHDALDKYQPQYTDGYDKNVRLVILEYENALYLLVTGLSLVMATQIDVVQNGYQIKIQKKSGSTFGVTEKTIHELAKQLSNKEHKGYLEDIIASKDHLGVNTEIKESTFMESAVSDTIDLINSVFKNAKSIKSFVKRTFVSLKNSVFGIVPLIRSILYLRYKKKADTILALEQQIEFIERNIEQLNNIKGMDEKKKQDIIKKQKAYIIAYKKKAEKLRAELTEGEKDAAVAIKKEDPEIGKNSDDGDFVLEGVSLASMFTEATAASIAKRREKEEFDKKAKKMKSNHSSFNNQSELSSNKSNNKELKKFDKKLLDKVFDEFHEKTRIKSIHLNLSNGVETDSPKKLTASKFGGNAYWPNGKEYPSLNGKDMILLAQINFGELPHIPDYPTSGILQFFVPTAECDYDDIDKMKVVYHENVNVNQETIDTTKKPSMSDSNNNGIFNEVYYLTGTVKDAYPCDLASYSFNNIFMPIFNKYFETDCKWFYTIEDEFENPREVWKELYSRASENSWGSKVGGYPNFTQYDPRETSKGTKSKYDKLLLQIDSEKGIMWGDCGIANVFISSSDLKNKKFDDVFFTWDCC